MDKMYSTIVFGGSGKKHVFDRENNKVVCGQDRYKNVPFRIYKEEHNTKKMLGKLNEYADRRKNDGCWGSHKFICRNCYTAIEKKVVKHNLIALEEDPQSI